MSTLFKERLKQALKKARQESTSPLVRVPPTFKFNPHQSYMYNKALLGLKFYSKTELSKLSDDKKKHIAKAHRKTEKILNLWKQEICSQKSNSLFLQMFPKSEFTKQIINFPCSDPTYVNDLKFSQLGICKVDIAYKLIEKRILPKNFFSLKEDKPSLEKF